MSSPFAHDIFAGYDCGVSTEDRAMLLSNSSAVLAPKTAGTRPGHPGLCPSLPDGPKATNLRGLGTASPGSWSQRVRMTGGSGSRDKQS